MRTTGLFYMEGIHVKHASHFVNPVLSKTYVSTKKKMFDLNKTSFRQQFLQVWEKHQNKSVLTPLEEQILTVIVAHPEYHEIIENLESSDEKDMSRAFMHMSLHLALMEQISTNRPHGIQDLFVTQIQKGQYPHKLEHLMMDVLGQFMWEMARDNKAPNDERYLEKLKQRISQFK